MPHAYHVGCLTAVASNMSSAVEKSLFGNIKLRTVEMHTAGEPFRIVVSGYPKFEGETILEKRRFAREKLDHLRKLLMFEPRGHHDMYGAILVEPDLPGADLAVLFTHNEGYSTMCGHGVIALGRFAVDHGFVKPQQPETEVAVQCPCGLVRAFVEYNEERKKTGQVRFNSVPAFVFALDTEVQVEGYGSLKVDIAYGGAFYALISAHEFGLDVRRSCVKDIVNAATAVASAIKAKVQIKHPDSEGSDLDFLYGVIVTDGQDAWSDQPTANICVFADAAVDRSPTGSGVTARVALQHAKGQIALQQTRSFESGLCGTVFTGKAIKMTKCGSVDAVIVEVSGRAHYTGEATYTIDEDDPVGSGFLLRYE
ncbi:trans-L-3-hydroxyproline dehydratase-like [Acanthaster planci]|uniref:trans-L-3-hydroxyproline dehydratase n=1 Tax=Acanthaster planci TaxID=133434 RepID=A0A8B7Y8X8_ACAPL|nr:trans-L-3-hydroxyproline dehydratase-like [Acanthaster planci]